ncbi:MAG: ABC transporter substrate-binding protein [Acidobacteriota bacterium]|nr:ABC transporter substrate-binding protein [Acidobacteriota bacterium]
MRSPTHFRCLLLILAAVAFSSTSSVAQSPSAAPYAAIDRNAVNYNGPGRDAGHDLAGAEIRIGLLAPLSGSLQAEGDALRRAAQMAIDEINGSSPLGLSGGNHLSLVARDESGPWGQASKQVVQMVFDDRAVALITSSDGGTAHLAEQVGNKIGVPVLTLSTDTTTTEINLPWIFRMGTTDTAQAQAFARDIFQIRKFKRVVLLNQDDRDGRIGGDEFAKAAREMSTPAPIRIVVEPGNLPEETGMKELETAQAIVIWTDAAAANLLTARLRNSLPTVPVYLCHKAAESDPGNNGQLPCPTCVSQDGNRWIASAAESPEAWRAFRQRYQKLYGAEPGLGAAEAYDAVRILAATLRQSGPNRARLRDALAGISGFPGASGVISFDRAGNDTSPVVLLKIR